MKISKNVVAYHLSRLEGHKENELPIDYSFKGETLFILSELGKDYMAWLADIVNYLVSGCIPDEEFVSVLSHYHSSPYGGYMSANCTALKVLQPGLFCSPCLLPQRNLCVSVTFIKEPVLL
nr:Retrovirus-related Pol polyprotein from transposon 17.6 [Ipomoea batatas]